MRVSMRDTTKHADYGELFPGDVLDVADQDGERWVRMRLAEKTDGDLHRKVESDPTTFANRPDGPVFDALVGRPSYPTNVPPEVHAIVEAKDAEIARLRAQLAEAAPAEEAALPADESTEDAKPRKKG